MSFVIVAPEALMSVASEVAGIGSALNAANAAAAAPTTGVLAAAADEVSAAMAALFGAHAQEYQRLSAQAAGFHAQFVQALNAGVNSYASAEAANASPLQAVEQQVLGLINGPAQTLLGRPLIGNGADGAPGTGQPGGPGGLLWGNGGNGGGGGGGVRVFSTHLGHPGKKGVVFCDTRLITDTKTLSATLPFHLTYPACHSAAFHLDHTSHS
uniref:PE family protein n=2 Tax=Mycobacterium tuberculosis TaxID=1773 RepID=UPI0020771D86